MAKVKFKRIVRRATAAEKRRHAAVRKKIMEEFPPVERVYGKRLAAIDSKQ